MKGKLGRNKKEPIRCGKCGSTPIYAQASKTLIVRVWPELYQINEKSISLCRTCVREISPKLLEVYLL